MSFYVLDGKTPVKASDRLRDKMSAEEQMHLFTAWAEFFSDDKNRRVGETTVYLPHTGIYMRVSTMFIGLAVNDSPAPKLFETVVFSGGKYDYPWIVKAATWDEAEANHHKVIDQLKRMDEEKKLPETCH